MILRFLHFGMRQLKLDSNLVDKASVFKVVLWFFLKYFFCDILLPGFWKVNTKNVAGNWYWGLKRIIIKWLNWKKTEKFLETQKTC